jgi:hypothetical protein
MNKMNDTTGERQAASVRLIRGYSEVRIGDFYPTELRGFIQPLCPVVSATNPDGFTYAFPSGGTDTISGERNLPNLTLFRRTPEGLEVLAGENAYRTLTSQSV